MTAPPGLVSAMMLRLRTARHLRAEQIAYRGLRRVQRLLPARAPRVDAALRDERLRAIGEALARLGPPDAECDRRAREVASGTYTLVGHARALPAVDWNAPYESPLWTYHLHYFDYAVDLAWAFRESRDAEFARCFERLALDWIAHAQPGRSRGWDPYPLSLRTANWLFALSLFGDALDAGAANAIARSVAEQLAVLARRLEWDVSANHLAKNLWALWIGSLAFAGRDASVWRRVATRSLERAMREQVLADGMHYERSPMYHAIVLYDLLILIYLSGAAGDADATVLREPARRMTAALGSVARPDGTLHLFNDAADGHAPALPRISALAERVLDLPVCHPSGLWRLPDAGYYGWARGDGGERIAIDCGAPGPPQQPGHAHCDLLGFELDLAGGPCIVDAGVAGYDGDPLREYVRSTRAHNTVAIGGREQSELWGAFRVARRAVVTDALASMRDGAFVFTGAYRPYHDPCVRHRRTIARAESASAITWTITDLISSAAGRDICSYLHLHPRFAATQDAPGRITAVRDDGVSVSIETFGVDAVRLRRGELAPAQGWHCPRFGRPMDAVAIEASTARYDGTEFGYRITVRRSEGRPAR